ncbi:MAG: hypothetical protein Q8R92_16210 [Deltaproteobacteria bacterium]|nr:hypothetical protein [Deltaproteobacteria bacterium]
MAERKREAEKSLLGRLPDVAKSMLVLSLGGVFMAEETLRRATRDMKLTREAVDAVLSQAERGKKEFFEAIAAEIGKAVRDLDVNKVGARFLKDFEIDIEARIAFTPRTAGGRGSRGGRQRGGQGLRLSITTDPK